MHSTDVEPDAPALNSFNSLLILCTALVSYNSCKRHLIKDRFPDPDGP
jgi:hypothetical protein